MPEDELELLTVSDIAEMAARVTGKPMSRQHAYHLAKRQDFPVPVGRIRRGRVWSRADVETFLKTYARQRGWVPGRPARGRGQQEEAS